MASRRLAGLQCRLEGIMRQRQVAHIAAPCNPHQTLGYQTAAQALRVAAASIAARPAPWCRAARGFSAQAATEAPEHDVDLHVTDAAVERLDELAADTLGQPLVLRLTVEGGGCSGFTYLFDLENSPADDDRILTRGLATLVCDPVSYEFVRGSTIDYTTDIIRSAFEVVSNPNATQSCGCGSSFSPKM